MAAPSLHLTIAKNFFSVVAGVCVVGLAVIPLTVSAQHWDRWEEFIIALCAIAVAALIVQAVLQSREDHARAKKESERDEKQNLMKEQLDQLTPKGAETKSASLVEAERTLVEAQRGILPLNPPVNFNARQYFSITYHSLWTDDIAKRIRIAALQNKDYFTTEEFYTKFIGVGLVAYLHDITWAYIWRSQFLMLIELNRRGGNMALGVAKEFYDQGARDFPNSYTNYPFDRWLGFMQAQQLLIRHPSEMLEITIRGRDFLSYSAHNSRTADQRRS